MKQLKFFLQESNRDNTVKIFLNDIIRSNHLVVDKKFQNTYYKLLKHDIKFMFWSNTNGNKYIELEGTSNKSIISSDILFEGISKTKYTFIFKNLNFKNESSIIFDKNTINGITDIIVENCTGKSFLKDVKNIKLKIN